VSQFVVVSVMGLLIRAPILTFLEPPLIGFFNGLSLRPAAVSAVFLAHNFTLAFAVLVVMFWNFFANRYWTYSDVQG
jgi:hypothetical protein